METGATGAMGINFDPKTGTYRGTLTETEFRNLSLLGPTGACTQLAGIAMGHIKIVPDGTGEDSKKFIESVPARFMRGEL